MKRMSKIVGVVSILLAAVIWAIEPVLARFSSEINKGDSLETITVRAALVAFVGLMYVLLTREKIRMTRKQFSAIFFTALISSVVADLIYYKCLLMVPAVNAVLIGHLQPVFIVLMGFSFLKNDKLTIYDFGGILLMLTAATIVIARNTSGLFSFNFGTSGDLLVVLVTVLWALGSIIMRRNIKGLTAGVITLFRFTTAFVFYSFFLAARYVKNPDMTFSINKYQILLGFLVGIGYVLYYEGLRRIKAAQAGSLELASPVFAAIFGGLFLGESMQSLQWVGIAILFPGIYLLSRREKE